MTKNAADRPTPSLRGRIECYVALSSVCLQREETQLEQNRPPTNVKVREQLTIVFSTGLK